MEAATVRSALQLPRPDVYEQVAHTDLLMPVVYEQAAHINLLMPVMLCMKAYNALIC